MNGKIVGVPALVDNLALVYNKKLFRAGRDPVPDGELDVAGPALGGRRS